MKKIIYGAMAVLLAASVPFFSSSDSAEAANFLGCKMKYSTIKWKDATTDTGYYVAAVDAMNSWGNNTNVGFQKVNSGANLTVANGNFGNTGFDGIMKGASSLNAPSCSGGNWGETAFAWLNNHYTNTYSAAAKRSVFTHEVGHALGLAHNPSGTCSTMAVMHPSTQNRFVNCGISTVRADDIRGINSLY